MELTFGDIEYDSPNKTYTWNLSSGYSSLETAILFFDSIAVEFYYIKVEILSNSEEEQEVGDECTAAEEDAIVEPTLVDGEAKYYDGFLTKCEKWVESDELTTFYTSQGVVSTTIDGLVLQSKYSYYPATDEWVQECVAYAFDTDENWYLDC